VRRYLCNCCGAEIRDGRPQNPDRDTGYGTCEACRVWIGARIAKRPDEDWTAERRSMLDPKYA
jgi:hypothetical protein